MAAPEFTRSAFPRRALECRCLFLTFGCGYRKIAVDLGSR